jgi:hypothetical protein
MKYTNLIALALISVTAALAQSWSQPVREVEKEARLSVSGYCSVGWPLGQGDSAKSCVVYSVPAGKRLAIRYASVHCSGHTGNNFTTATLNSRVNNGQGEIWEYTNLGFSDDPGYEQYEVFRWISQPIFHHASAGKEVTFSVRMTGASDQPSQPLCTARIQGFLLSEN